MKEGCLRGYIARGVYQVEDSKRGRTNKQVIFTRRPWWSKVGAELFALPGGQIEPQDFIPLIVTGYLTLDQYNDPEFVPSEELIRMAAENTVKREFLEELGEEAQVMVAVGLIYIGTEQNYDPVNDITWVSHVYGKNGDQKMTLTAKGNADGVVWESSSHLHEEDSRLDFLPGQFAMALQAVTQLG